MGEHQQMVNRLGYFISQVSQLGLAISLSVDVVSTIVQHASPVSLV